MLTHYELQEQITLARVEPEKYWPTKYKYKKCHHVFYIRTPARRSRSESLRSNDFSSGSSITTMYTVNRIVKLSSTCTNVSVATSMILPYNQLEHLKLVLIGHLITVLNKFHNKYRRIHCVSFSGGSLTERNM